MADEIVPQTLTECLAVLTESGVRDLPMTAARGNWLGVEKQVAQVLNDLLATAEPVQGQPGRTHGELALVQLLEDKGQPPVLEPLLRATEINAMCRCTLELVARALAVIHEAAPDARVESEDWFRWVYNTRDEPVRRSDMGAYEPVAQRVAESLELMPVFQGLMVVGSFAETDKHDGFNDLDLYCYCRELPSSRMRADFYSRLGMESPGSEIAFEYLRMDDINVHLSIPLVRNQSEALDRLWQDGDESNCGQFADPGFAASAYHLARGRVLRDPSGLLEQWKAQCRQYPPALSGRIRDTWQPEWTKYSATAREAMGANDRVRALIALRHCREAYLRILLAKDGLLCDPNGLKWTIHEVHHLPARQREKLVPLLDSVRFSGAPSMPEQFARLCEQWHALGG